MKIPSKILGYTLTPAERVEFVKNNIPRETVADRIRRGWCREEWFKPKGQNLIIGGHIVNEERQKLMKKLGINTNTASSRMARGMSFDEATTEPLRGDIKMPKQEVIEVIGRIKYLNKQPETTYPYTIPAGILKRAKEYKIDIDKVKELPV